jgi:hypothetical protein
MMTIIAQDESYKNIIYRYQVRIIPLLQLNSMTLYKGKNGSNPSIPVKSIPHHGHDEFTKKSSYKQEKFIQPLPHNIDSAKVDSCHKSMDERSDLISVVLCSKGNSCKHEKSIRPRRIQFSTTGNAIIDIPPRTAYTSEQSRKLWYSGTELQTMIWRNTVEYNFERGDWKSAVEEDKFCLYNGIKLHPAHVPLNYYSSNASEREHRDLLKSCLDAALASTDNLLSLLKSD